MLRHPIPLERPPVPWLVRPSRQGLAGLRRLGGKWWPKRFPQFALPRSLTVRTE